MKYDYGFIGCGNMGGAILGRLASCHPELTFSAFDLDTAKTKEFSDTYKNITVSDTADIINNSKFVFLGLKPQVLPSFLESNIDKNRECDCTFVSMAAGTPIGKLSAYFSGVKMIRIMPNLPVSVGEGVVLFAVNENVPADVKKDFAGAMSCTGLVTEIPEDKIDAGSAISGCGPAFAYMFIEALADGGVQCGLTRAQATAFAAQMLAGSAKTMLENGVHPEEMKDRVCSPGGTTIAGVHALEQNGFRFASSEAVIAAYKRTLELK